MKTNIKFAGLSGIAILVAIGTIQVANLTISGVSHLHRVYFDWEEIEAINATTVTFPKKTASSTPNLIKEATSTSGTIREITAYNAGDPSQTDQSPCDGAGGNICEALTKGQKVCAANFVPLGSKLKIQNYGVCIVLDRMAKRFQNRVDIAMKLEEKDRALKFGRQNLLVEIIK